MDQHHHRSSATQKKGFKGRNSGHKSKREINRKNPGRVEINRGNIKNNKPITHSKQDVRNTKKQIIKNRREVLISQKRGIGSEPAPKLVAIINLGGDKVNLSNVRSSLLDYLAEGKNYNENGPVTMRSKKYKTRFTIFQSSEEIYCMMDIGKIADILLFVVSVDGITEDGHKVISILKAQGIGSIFAVSQGLEGIQDKKKKKLVNKQILHDFQHEFPSIARILPLDKKEDSDQVVRFLDVLNPVDTEWRKERSFVLADKYHFQKHPKLNSEFQSLGDEEKGTLVISGYLKGGNRMSANTLVHLPYFGDFQVIKIVSTDDPCMKEKLNNNNNSEMIDDDNKERILHQFDPQERDTLDFENVPDPLAGEQNWPEEQDLKDDSFEEIEEAAKKLKKKKKKVPKGTSSYQAAWIPDESSEGSGDSDDDDLEDEEDGKEEKIEENSKFKKPNQNQKQNQNQNQKKAKDESDEEDDDEDESMEDEKKVPKNSVRFDGEAEQIESSSEDQMSVQDSQFSIRIKDRSNHTMDELEKDQLEWPDELNAPANSRASIRFQKYRGLKSFRTSVWDPKESLPEDYARVFQFENWKRAVNRSKKKIKDGAISGQYVSIHIADFPERLISNIDAVRPLIVGSLLKHEHKFSVIHFTVNKHPNYPVPICSKEDLIFCYGWRRIQSNPIFSETAPSVDKQKYCKFLHAGVNGSATFYGPITFGTCPLVVFKETKDGLHLAGTGSFVKADPDAVVVKRIILTGNPYKIHKRVAFIRGMFHFPEDIRWFKPVELWTKYGKVGNIKEPHGTHGLMKCIFDNPVSHNDTVCMSLYRRVFPKWTSKELIY